MTKDQGIRIFRAVSMLAVATGIGLSAYAFWLGWSIPIVDVHGFRQTQTALTVYWLLRGADWVSYETPVLGGPWRIPMEFPIYQWVVAMAAPLAPGRLDQVGRAVSYAFFLLCVLPLRAIYTQLGLSREALRATIALTLAAPVYVFWSRTFMIESTALFLSLSFAALYLHWLRAERWPYALAAIAAGVLAALTKVTTLVPWGVFAAMASVPLLSQLPGSGTGRALVRRGLWAAAIAAAVLLPMIWWVHYSDHLKSLNLLGKALTSSRLSGWNFGAVEQRTSAQLWRTAILERAIPEAVGSVAILGLAALAMLALKRTAVVWTAVFAFAWLSAFLIFTNLHIVHNYYQFSNALFLTAALGIVVAELARSRPLLASGMLIVTLGLQWSVFDNSYRSHLEADLSRYPLIGRFVSQHTPADTAILVLGNDWSSEVPYYSERKALALPNWASKEDVETILADPAAFVAPLPLSAIVRCNESVPDSQKKIADATLARLPVGRVERIAGCDVLLLESK